MIFSRDYIGYLARRTVKHLIDAKMITTSDLKVTEARVNEGLIEEISLEDRINEEVRVILDSLIFRDPSFQAATRSSVENFCGVYSMLNTLASKRSRNINYSYMIDRKST